MQTKIILFEDNFDSIDSNMEEIDNCYYEMEKRVTELANFKNRTIFHFNTALFCAVTLHT